MVITEAQESQSLIEAIKIVRTYNDDKSFTFRVGDKEIRLGGNVDAISKGDMGTLHNLGFHVNENRTQLISYYM